MLRFARATVEQAGQVVVERVSLEVEAGQALALIGRDGSGTTDLLEAAATAVRLHAGDIEVAGISIRRKPDEVRRRIGYVPAEAPEWPGVRAGDVARDVHDVAVALDRHHVGERDRPDRGDAADVVAPEVDEHHVLGPLLRIGQELLGKRAILLRRGAAPPRAGEGPHRHRPVDAVSGETRGTRRPAPRGWPCRSLVWGLWGCRPHPSCGAGAA